MPGQIKKIVKVYYPHAEAVVKAAEQNFIRDEVIGLTDGRSFANQSDEEKEMYYVEARELFKINSENYLPIAPAFEHICVTHPLMHGDMTKSIVPETIQVVKADGTRPIINVKPRNP